MQTLETNDDVKKGTNVQDDATSVSHCVAHICDNDVKGPSMGPLWARMGSTMAPLNPLPPRYPQDHSFLARTSHTCSQCSVFVNFSITTLLEAPNTSVRADVRCGRSAHLSPRPFMPPHPSYPHHGQPPHRPPQSHRPPQTHIPPGPHARFS